MDYAKYVYSVLKHECANLDSIYEDYITYLVGVTGLNALKENQLIEACGILNGRQLYVLVEK